MPDSNLKLEQLKLAYDYTKFHVGLYGTLITGLIAILKYCEGTPYVFFLKITVCLFLIAAMCGAILASSFLDAYGSYEFWQSEIGDFWESKIGPFKWKWFKAKTWGFIEHAAFWVGILVVVCAFLLKAR
ncbi:MAG: hypothetical protein HOP19_14340 [Acidobacteria bacterium]|nr:hypothetical protein [Acidobacteriota bacterium]